MNSIQKARWIPIITSKQIALKMTPISMPKMINKRKQGKLIFLRLGLRARYTLLNIWGITKNFDKNKEINQRIIARDRMKIVTLGDTGDNY